MKGLGLEIPRAKAVIQNNPAVWSDPKPKFWLWDFRKRDLSYASFGYGLFFGIGLCLGVHAAFTGNLATYSLSVIFFANGKYLHSNLPLSK